MTYHGFNEDRREAGYLDQGRHYGRQLFALALIIIGLCALIAWLNYNQGTSSSDTLANSPPVIHTPTQAPRLPMDPPAPTIPR